MRAIILSAGQGSRLHPLTENLPKCLLPVQSAEPVLGVQLRALEACGIEHATVLVGFGADQVDDYLEQHCPPGIEVETRFNPFYAVSDNLATCWIAQDLMRGDFVLLNGDTLFEPRVLGRLLASPDAPLTLVVNEKNQYDADDMKVSVSAGQLLSVGKTLDLDTVTGESIGLVRFAASGAKIFTDELNRALRDPDALGRWYLSIIDGLTEQVHIGALSVTGLWWAEVDFPEDLRDIRDTLAAGRGDASACESPTSRVVRWTRSDLGPDTPCGPDVTRPGGGAPARRSRWPRPATG